MQRFTLQAAEEVFGNSIVIRITFVAPCLADFPSVSNALRNRPAADCHDRSKVTTLQDASAAIASCEEQREPTAFQSVPTRHNQRPSWCTDPRRWADIANASQFERK